MSKTILIVDDSATMRQQLRGVLEFNGYTVVEAADGAMGVREAVLQSPDLIIADLNMPVMDGFEMIRQIKKLEVHKNTPIFVLTTEGLSATRRDEGKAIGVTAWMGKPFQPDQLVKALKSLLHE